MRIGGIVVVACTESIAPPPPAVQLAFTMQPSSATAGVAIDPVVAVAIEDASGITVTSATNVVTLTLGTNPGGDTLKGTASVAAVAGVATFSNLHVDKAGSGYTLKAAATGLIGATSIQFTIAAAPATRLAFTVQPSNSMGGATITPPVQVAAQDSFGNLATGFGDSVTVALGGNPAPGTLSGTTVVSAIGGVAIFRDLSIAPASLGYTLTASAGSLTGVSSVPFAIVQPTGSLRITAATSDSVRDPDGYAVCVDSASDGHGGTSCPYGGPHAIGVNGTVTMTVDTGAHAVLLTGVAAYCTVGGTNPRSVDVPVGDMVRVDFAVSCEAPVDSLLITTTTAGVALDPDGYTVGVDEVCDFYYGCYYLWTAPVGVNGTVAWTGPTGTHTVGLLDVAGNCTVAGGNRRTVSTSPGVPTYVTFSVTCVQTGSVRVTTATAGADLDPDGYRVGVNGWYSAIGVNASYTFDRLLPGDYSVSLDGVAGNCTLGGPGAVTVTVTGGATVDVAFAVACAPWAAIRATVTTSGIDPDPDGYLVRVVGPGSGGDLAVPANGTVVVPRLSGGTYTVSLEGIAVNCSVTGLDQLTVSVALGDTAGVAFDVDCPTAELLAVAMQVNTNTDVYLVKSNGTGLMRLTSDAAADAEPAWSASSGRIAFVSVRDGNSEIYVMNADGSGQLRLTANPGEDRHPAWSPDGLKLSFWSERDGNPEIYVMNADGSSPVRLTVNGAQDIDPAWSPDGLSIAFASNRGATDLEIYRMNTDGSGVTRLTFSGGNRQPDWSPAGTKLVYSHTYCDYYYGCVGDLGVINADGSGEGALPTDEGHDPVWSPDGRWIAFTALGYYRVSGIRGDGTGLVPMVANAFQPAWRR